MKKMNKKKFVSKSAFIHQQSRRKALKIIGSGAALMVGGALNSNILAGGIPEIKIAGSGKENKELPGGFKYFIGIVGSPSSPEIDWSDEEITKIKDLGVNMLQLSIAWGGKPADEVLNLEDLDIAQSEKWAYRIKQASKFGMDVIAQFGIPKLLYTENGYSIVQPACIMAPEVRSKYARLLGDFLDKFPEVKNVLIYTFDQNAWLCSEFGPCPRCSGIPLHERLPVFLDHLNSVMQKHRPGSRLWWKPWEISNGTTVKIIQKLKADNFGLVLNPSSANEVYPFNDRAYKADLGIKRVVQVATGRQIPITGEFDYTFYKGYYLITDYFPRFVYEQLQGWKEIDGVVGIKEYFGFAPSQFSVNAAMLKACMKSPHATLDEMLTEIAEPYGKKEVFLIKQAWERVARGVEAFPWDVTYLIGPLGLDKNSTGYHNWEPVTISNGTWNTPAWKTNRKANFMLTEESKAHPWLFEDIGLQLEDSSRLLQEAVSFYDKAIAERGKMVEDISIQRNSIAQVARAILGKALHFLETLTAQDARLVGYDENQWQLVIRRLDGLLKRDVENQQHADEVAQKLNEFRKDPKLWLQKNLNPLAYESKCSIDWSRYVPYAGRQD